MVTPEFLVCALLAGPLTAQSYLVPPSTLPSVGPCNAFPFHSTAMRYQVLIKSTDLAAGRICGLELAPCGSGVRSMATITIKLAHFTGTTLDPAFDVNVPTNTLPVLDSVDYKWIQTANVWNEIGLQDCFLYNGTANLVVDIVVTGTAGAPALMHAATTNERLFLAGYSGQPTGILGGPTAVKLRVLMGDANTGLFGAGCTGTNGIPAFSFVGTAQLGTTLGFACANAPANAFTILTIGTNSHLPIFPAPMLPLAWYPGCTRYHDIIWWGPVLANGTGHALVQVPIPDDSSLLCAVFYSSYVVVDPVANIGGLTVSNYGRGLLGN